MRPGTPFQVRRAAFSVRVVSSVRRLARNSSDQRPPRHEQEESREVPPPNPRLPRRSLSRSGRCPMATPTESPGTEHDLKVVPPGLPHDFRPTEQVPRMRIVWTRQSPVAALKLSSNLAKSGSSQRKYSAARILGDAFGPCGSPGVSVRGVERA